MATMTREEVSMFTIPYEISCRYTSLLRENSIDGPQMSNYLKWLKYFLDYRDKYPVPDVGFDQIRLVSDKLREKKQSEEQCRQAEHAVSLFLGMQMQTSVEPRSVSREANNIEAMMYPDGCTSRSGLTPSAASISEKAEAGEDMPVPAMRTETAQRVRVGSSHYLEAGYDEKPILRNGMRSWQQWPPRSRSGITPGRR